MTNRETLLGLAERLERGEPTGFVEILERGPERIGRMDNGTLVSTATVFKSRPLFRTTKLHAEAAAALRIHANNEQGEDRG